jgi:hypothetical protein
MLLAGTGAAQEIDCQPSSDPAVIRQAEQKLVLLLRMVGDTGPAKRVDGGNNEEAKMVLAEARQDATLAGAALDEGCAAESIELASAGLKQASRAFSLAKSRPSEADQVYRQVLDRTQSFLQSLESQPEDSRGMSEADITGMHRQIERAEELAVGGEYQAAADLLKPVVDRLERRLAAIYDQQTVFYEKTFEGPADEYSYLAQQFEGYRILFEQYAGNRQPLHTSKQEYEDYLAGAATLSAAAQGHARASDWESALEKMREAVRNYERAMRLIGIGY